MPRDVQDTAEDEDAEELVVERTTPAERIGRRLSPSRGALELQAERQEKHRPHKSVEKRQERREHKPVKTVRRGIGGQFRKENALKRTAKNFLKFIPGKGD